MTGLQARVPEGHSEMSGQETCVCDAHKRPPIEDNANRFENIVTIQQLIDLTDKPIRLTRDEIGWSRVKSTASNCVCCCCNNSITLVTTDESYVLDHIPLDNIEAAQANSGLQYLALANDEKLAVIDLVESKSLMGDNYSPSLKTRAKTPSRIPAARAAGHAASATTQTRFVDLGALGHCMGDVIFWRWIDELTLALVTQDALYTCRMDQIQLNHPAATAAPGRSLNQLLALTRICDLDPNLAHLCQITDVQRDVSTNLYAIRGLYAPQSAHFSPSSDAHHLQSNNDNSSNLVTKSDHHKQNHDNNNNNNNNLPVKQNLAPSNSQPLRHNFSSVPGRLSQMASLGGSPQPTSLDLASNFTTTKQPNPSRAINSLRRKISSSSSKFKKISTTKCDISPTVAGLTQIYCKLRDRSQLIRAHASSFTTRSVRASQSDNQPDEQRHSTTLVLANRSGNKLKVYFIGMATTEDLTTSGQNVARSTKLDLARGPASRADFPTAIVCSTLTPSDERTHVAMIVTKYGHLFVCSVTHGSILFDVQVSYDIVSGAILESKSRGLMLICRNGQVLLARIDEDRLRQMLDETSSLRHVSSQMILSLSRDDPEYQRPPICNVLLDPLDIGLEVIISTKL